GEEDREAREVEEHRMTAGERGEQAEVGLPCERPEIVADRARAEQGRAPGMRPRLLEEQEVVVQEPGSERVAVERPEGQRQDQTGPVAGQAPVKGRGRGGGGERHGGPQLTSPGLDEPRAGGAPETG